MIKIYLSSIEREREFVKWIGGEINGRIYTNFPMKGMTRKDRRLGMYKLINAPASHDKGI